MVGIVYTGESYEELQMEIEMNYSIHNNVKPKIFVEPSFEKEFQAMIGYNNYERFSTIRINDVGMIAQYIGIEITSTEREKKKKNQKTVKEITLQEVADKFGVAVENLRIKK